MNGQFDRDRVLKKYSFCVYCESRKELTVDHVIPFALRKRFKLSKAQINNYGNLVAACQGCNMEKSGKSLEDFFSKHPDYKRNFLRNARYVSDIVLSSLRYSV